MTKQAKRARTSNATMQDLTPSGGYTIIELVIVVTLMALIAAIGIPQFARSLDRAEAKASAGKIAALMRLARNESIARKIPVSVVLEPEKSRAYIVAGRPEEGKQAALIDNVLELPRSAKLWAGSAGNAVGEWSPEGGATAMTVFITSTDAKSEDDENGYRVEVDPLSGRPHVRRNGDVKR